MNLHHDPAVSRVAARWLKYAAECERKGRERDARWARDGANRIVEMGMPSRPLNEDRSSLFRALEK